MKGSANTKQYTGVTVPHFITGCQQPCVLCNDTSVLPDTSTFRCIWV